MKLFFIHGWTLKPDAKKPTFLIGTDQEVLKD